MTDQERDAILCTPEEFAKFVADARLWVDTCLKDGDETDLRPVLHVLSRQFPSMELGLGLFVCDVPFNEDADKERFMKVCAVACHEKKLVPVAAAICSEAWQSRGQRKGAPHLQPRHDPARQEIVLVMASTLGGKQAHLDILEIHRDQDNRIQPEAWLPGMTNETARSPLLEKFWRAFAATVGFHPESLQ